MVLVIIHECKYVEFLLTSVMLNFGSLKQQNFNLNLKDYFIILDD